MTVESSFAEESSSSNAKMFLSLLQGKILKFDAGLLLKAIGETTLSVSSSFLKLMGRCC